MPSPEGGLDFVEFVVELPGIQPHPRGKHLDGLTGDLQSARTNVLRRPRNDLLFTRTKSQVRLVVEFGHTRLGESLVGATALVWLDGAHQKNHPV